MQQLDLAEVLPATVADLRRLHGDRWFEYGLVERAYAARQPDGWALMVQRWGHTALVRRPYTASSWLASALGRLSAIGAVAFHDGPGSGRWAYNGDLSWWACVPPPDWADARLAWVDVLDDSGEAPRRPGDPCRLYVPGS